MQHDKESILLFEEFCEKMYETIRKEGSQYVVTPEKSHKKLGTHKTKKEAQAQLAAIEISKAERGK